MAGHGGGVIFKLMNEGVPRASQKPAAIPEQHISFFRSLFQRDPYNLCLALGLNEKDYTLSQN